jgi:non-lysosomal glucosylceramidase
MKQVRTAAFVLVSLALFCSPAALWAGGQGGQHHARIPKAAWKRPIGLPLKNPGKTAIPNNIDDGYWQGAPVGGFGAGTFSRTYRGDFARWHLKAGANKYQTVYADQFAMFQRVQGSPKGTAQVLFTGHPQGPQLSSWKWNYPVGAGDYYSLYPKSWFDYRSKEFPAHVVLEQFSPILPNNYRTSSYPVAVYRWFATNPTRHAVTVSVLLSWTNMGGWFRSFSHNFHDALNNGDYNEFRSETLGAAGTMKGIVFGRHHAHGTMNAWDGQMAIAALQTPGVEISYQTTFAPQGSGAEVWRPFARDGKLADSNVSWVSTGEPLAGAIAVRFTLAPGQTRLVPMVISWDFPVVQFGEGRTWYRKYTDYFGTSGENAWKIAQDGLENAAAWSREISAWQRPYIQDASKPLWLRGMLFNELYVIADGGSFWGRPVAADTKSSATFAWMECYDYPFYGTLDVAFYGSIPLAKFWPRLDRQFLREFSKTVAREWPDKIVWEWKSMQTHRTVLFTRKRKGALPHDLGTPMGDPFYVVNDYGWQNVNGWKDLNTKFVLMVYRDFVWSGRKDLPFLRSTWPSVQEAMAYMKQFETGHDGLLANSGYPDQTYDTWTASGPSAYSDSIWLAALRASEEMARALGDTATAAKYHDAYLRGRKSYIRELWTGQYFRYDTGSTNPNRDAIEADQLAGQWYAYLTGLGNLVPKAMQRKALETIYANNVMKFAHGTMGAVNGMNPDGTVLDTNMQSKEVWTGTTFDVASLMLSEGMTKQAYQTAWGIYNVVYQTKGYWFRTPEAYYANGNYRASMYMRPADIWALEVLAPPKK